GGASNLTVQGSFFLSDVVMYDTPTYPSTAQARFNGSIGMNLWTDFRNGTSANVSFPAPMAYENWSFPGAFNVSGVGYSMKIVQSYVGVHALYLLAGSRVVVHDTQQLAVAFGPLSESLSFTGLREQLYPSLLLHPADFYLQLLNTSVLTWNFYPDQVASLQFRSCQVGEIIATGNARVVVLNSNLTGDGGYYSVLGSARLVVYNTRISDELIAGGNGAIRLVNSSDTSPTPRELLATGTATLTSVNVQLTPTLSYAAEYGGTVYVEWNLSVSVTELGAPVGGAVVSAAWTGNSTLAGTGTTNPNGSVALSLLHRVIRATGSTVEDQYEVSATSGWEAAQNAVTMQYRTSLLLPLDPLIDTTSPANGATGVDLRNPVTVAFGFSMAPGPTGAAVGIVPRVLFAENWSAGNSTLTIQPLSPLAPNSSYLVTLGVGSVTAGGIPFPSDYFLQFATGALSPQPRVVSSNPLNGSTGLARSTNLTIGFSISMNAQSTASAFSVLPAVPSGNVSVGGSELTWSHSAPLSYNTSYAFTVNGSATSTAGTGLGHAFTVIFRTMAAPSNGSSHGPPAASGSSNTSPLPLVGALVGVILVAAVALLLLRRKGGTPPAPSTVPAPSPPMPPPAWKE
ncbi:MAG: Ig-like domain-containing protein, partial [Thermoplasmata archaeon]|nr:Ig-like domain-containing protein [Thermoplasmata archaeon]